METVTLLPMMHRGAEQILIFFDHHKGLNDTIRRLPAVKWSQTHKSWYLPLTENNYHLIRDTLRSVATIDTKALQHYLIKRKAVKAAEVPKEFPLQESLEKKQSVTASGPAVVAPEPTVAYRLSYENLISLQKTVDLLKLKAYSNSTIRTYRAELIVFFQVLGKHAAGKLATDDVKRWLLKCLHNGLTENTMHSRINALKFFYEQVLGKEKFFVDIPRPKKPHQLPRVLGEQEITRLFNAIANRKHKAILFTAYSAGLRVSEVVNMKLKHIDSDRMQIFIERAKGKKDRYVTLSPVLLDVLRKYIQLCIPRPRQYLFEGQGEPGTMYSARSAQKIFQIARYQAGGNKEGCKFSLPASFLCYAYIRKGHRHQVYQRTFGAFQYQDY